MSTHALGDVQLVTVQEVEAMLNEVVIPETSIDAKVAADTALTEKITAMKQMEEASDSNFHFSRLKNLPIATINIDIRNTTFKPSDCNRVITTVPNRYLPKYPVDFVTWGIVLDDNSSGDLTTYGGIVILNLDTNGDIKVKFVFPFGENYPTDPGSAAVTYITKE